MTRLLIALFLQMVLCQAADLETVENWTKLSEAEYSSREGLMAVSYKDAMFLSGGRGTGGLGFSDEVFRSTDGVSWELVNHGVIGRRAYHTMVVANDCMFIMGGQTFFTFYNDVWMSCDAQGANWTRVVENAPWPVRSGHAAMTTADGEIVIAGGCYNKNGNPAARSFRDDVWASRDNGATWEQRTPQAEWGGRSGPRLVESPPGRLLIIAGEVGFTPDTQLVDVWASTDGGAQWSLVTATPGFSARSGHGVVVDPRNGDIILIAGWPHLHDIWLSSDNGLNFTQVSDAAWNCDEDSCGKFDFWPVLHEGKLFTLGGSAAYATFGKLWDDTWVGTLTGR